MRALTKTGIRILSAKYRSILIKCAIINASVFVGVLGTGSAFAIASTPWDDLESVIENTEDNPIIIENNIEYSEGSEDITVNRTVTINGQNHILSGGSAYQGLTIGTNGNLTISNITMKNFKNQDGLGAAINNQSGKLDVAGTFTANNAKLGGAIYNNSTINNINANFNTNVAGYNTENNEALNLSGNGGAIYNYDGTIANIEGNFNRNSAFNKTKTSEDGGLGGAIYNHNQIDNINANFTGNVAGYVDHTTKTNVYTEIYNAIQMYNGKGGAIYNEGEISALTGNFSGNHATYGGAIYNKGAMNIYADNKNIKFNGNYVPENDGTDGGLGGAIYNDVDGTMGLYATSEKSITFTGSISSMGTFGAQDVDGIYNLGTLNINDGTTYTGTMNFQNIAGTGTTNIYGGIVNVAKDITQKTITIGSGVQLNATGNIITETLVNNGDITVPEVVANIQNNEGASITFNNNEIIIVNLTNSGTVNFNGYLNYPDSNVSITQNAGTINFSNMAATEGNPIKVFTMNGGLVNIADEDAYNILHINQLNLTGNIDFTIDADLENEISDRIKIHDIDNSEIASDKTITIKGINLLSDATQDKINISLFADDDTREALKNNVRSNIKGLTYSSIYKYNASYNSETGMIGFTRYNSGSSDDFNPYLYNPSVAAHTTAAMTTQIATLAMDKMDDIVHAQGRSGGDTTKSSNAWLKVMGLDDNVDFKNFNTVDSKAITVAGGFNTDKIALDNNVSAAFGAYAGYIGGKQHYTGNDIDQNGGYVGLSSVFTSGNAFLTATVNGGLLNNKADNMYGNDKFRTLWLGTGLKTGYNYAITDSVVLQPNVYGGYTLVNTEDYTSASGVKIATHNLNFFEIDPGLKLSAAIADGWTGSVQGKYAIVMDNGDDITANDIALQNISTKNYFEYGIGVDKSLTDAVYLGANINRHDGGRTGWNGSIEFRYKF